MRRLTLGRLLLFWFSIQGKSPSRRGNNHERFPESDLACFAGIFAEQYAGYPSGARPFLLSALVHTLALIIALTSGSYVLAHRVQIREGAIGLITDVSPYVLPPAPSRSGVAPPRTHRYDHELWQRVDGIEARSKQQGRSLCPTCPAAGARVVKDLRD